MDISPFITANILGWWEETSFCSWENRGWCRLKDLVEVSQVVERQGHSADPGLVLRIPTSNLLTAGPDLRTPFCTQLLPKTAAARHTVMVSNSWAYNYSHNPVSSIPECRKSWKLKFFQKFGTGSLWEQNPKLPDLGLYKVNISTCFNETILSLIKECCPDTP